MSTTSTLPRRIDTAHHHPRVRRLALGWVWECSCGGSSGRCVSTTTTLPWRTVVISALKHSGELSA